MNFPNKVLKDEIVQNLYNLYFATDYDFAPNSIGWRVYFSLRYKNDQQIHNVRRRHISKQLQSVWDYLGAKKMITNQMHNLDLVAIKNLYSYLSNHIICEAGPESRGRRPLHLMILVWRFAL